MISSHVFCLRPLCALAFTCIQSKGKTKGPPRLVDRADSFLAKHVASGNPRFVIALNFLMPWGSFVTYLAPRTTDSHSPHGGDPRVYILLLFFLNPLYYFIFVEFCYSQLYSKCLLICYSREALLLIWSTLFFTSLIECVFVCASSISIKVDPMLVKLAKGDEAYCRARLKLVRGVCCGILASQNKCRATAAVAVNSIARMLFSPRHRLFQHDCNNIFLSSSSLLSNSLNPLFSPAGSPRRQRQLVDQKDGGQQARDHRQSAESVPL